MLCTLSHRESVFKDELILVAVMWVSESLTALLSLNRVIRHFPTNIFTAAFSVFMSFIKPLKVKH